MSRTEIDGTTTALASHFEYKHLNSPNDVIVKSDRSIRFTDPTYGIDTDYEGNRGPCEQRGNFVCRIDPATNELRIVADDFVQPSGICFSPDDGILHIVDTGISPKKNGME